MDPPWLQALYELRPTLRRKPKKAIYEKLGWSWGNVWNRKVQPNLRASEVAKLADAAGVPRGRLFVVLCRKLGL